ncbi:MAG TPA: cyclic nucleotide-binding domain-containing protein, partial [Chloroflexota bacterium]|nr:cyclic nucleotide-binding domain-containing protein [Chloroflexota bacterium]
MRLVDLLNPAARAKDTQLAHALRAVPLFKDLPPDDLVRIWRALAEQEAPAGAVLCARGDPGDRFYVVRSGSLEVRLGLGPNGIGIRRLVPGNCFGEMALLTGAPRSADVVAAEDSVLWVLEQRDFQQITTSSIPLLQAINRDLCSRIDNLTQQVSDLETRLGTKQTPGVAGMRFGPYRVVEQIGAGGMAVVYSATHVETDEAAALKVLPSAWGDSEEFRRRLEREAAALRRIKHPNVVEVFHVGEVDASAGGGCFLAMEWLPHALDRVLLSRYPEPLPTSHALQLTSHVAHALAAAHDAGFIHRDVKPSNILIRADGSPVLTDFGLVLMRADAAAGRRLTADNVIVGTADYMAPEQVTGAPLDGRSDIYALG